MPEQFEPTSNHRSLPYLKGSLRAAASLILTLAVVIGGAGSAAAATPAPAAPKTTISPSPSPSAPAPAPKVKPRATAPTHTTPAKPATINKALAAKLATRTAATAALPGPAGCGVVGTTVSYTLYASAGSRPISTVNPAVFNYWGFNTSPGGALPPGDPGTTLFMCQSDTLSLTLVNKLPAPPAGNPANQHLSIELPAVKGVPDTAGFAADGLPHNLPAISGLAPGTYLYEAGPTPGGGRQVAMGLAGLLIVRPTGFGGSVNGSSAYGSILSQFAGEYTLSTTEVSTEFGDDPFTRDLHEFNPNLFLVNGKPFDPVAPNLIPVAPNDRLLLHQANLGLRDHSLTIAGHRQSLLAEDSRQLTNPQASNFNTDLATSWLTPGQVTDSFVTVDPKAQSGFTYPIYDAGFHFNNDAAGGLGGMLAELSVATGVGGVPTGPVTTNVAVSPLTNAGPLTGVPASGQITVTGTVDASAVRSEWFIDNVGISGSGCDGATHATRCVTINPNHTFTLTIPWATFLTALAVDNPLGGIDGDHVFWVHAADATNLWGVAAGDVQTVAVSGPAIFNVDLHNSPTNGSNPNDIDGSGDLVIWAGAISSLPDWNVLGAYVCLDTCVNRYDLFTNPPPTGPTYNGAYFPAGNFVNLAPYGVAYPTQSAACTPQATPGPPGGLGPAGPQPGGANVVSICGNIPASALQALISTASPFSTHHLSLYAYEGLNFNGDPLTGTVPAGWGVRNGFATLADIALDGQGPTTTVQALAPNNGFQNGPGNLGFLDSTRITATIDDKLSGGSSIANAEVLLTPTPVPAGSPAGTLTRCDGTTPPAANLTGTGSFMVPAGGAWAAGPAATAYAYIPLAEIRACQEGIVTFWVHGQDAAGNWGPYASVNLTLDKTAPTLSALTLNTVAGVSSITGTATDPGLVTTNIVGAEWFTGADPGLGNGLPVVSNPTPPPTFVAGNPVTFTFVPGAGHFTLPTVVSVRVTDGAGNWSAVQTVTVP
jgi:hypothetical protein